MDTKWLTWAKELQGIAQAGLAYSENVYDRERFQQVRELAARIIAEHTDLDCGVIQGLFCNETGYQTPKLDVRAAIFRGDTILLVHERIDGCWALPGGWAEPELSLRENVEKEVREEAGLIVQAQRLIAVQQRRRHNMPDKPFPYGVYKAFVLCREIGGQFADNMETQGSGFFSIDALPELSAGRTTYEQIALCLRAKGAKNWETMFD